MVEIAAVALGGARDGIAINVTIMLCKYEKLSLTWGADDYYLDFTMNIHPDADDFYFDISNMFSTNDSWCAPYQRKLFYGVDEYWNNPRFMGDLQHWMWTNFELIGEQNTTLKLYPRDPGFYSFFIMATSPGAYEWVFLPVNFEVKCVENSQSISLQDDELDFSMFFAEDFWENDNINYLYYEWKEWGEYANYERIDNYDLYNLIFERDYETNCDFETFEIYHFENDTQP